MVPLPVNHKHNEYRRSPDEGMDLATWLVVRQWRRHTHGMLKKWLYGALQASRPRCFFHDPTERGFRSSRPIRTFEDLVIFCTDMSRCFQKLTLWERQVLWRTVIQDYTYEEAAPLMGCSQRTISNWQTVALDHLTLLLVQAEIIILHDETLKEVA